MLFRSVLLKETAKNTPTVKNFLDKNIGDYYSWYINEIYSNINYTRLHYHYTDVSGTIYTKFDSYKLIFRFLETLDDDNIYSEKSITDIRNYLLTSIEDNLNIKAKIKYRPLQFGDIAVTLANTKKLKKIINFIPKVSIESGIKEFCNWYLDYY